MFIQMFLLFLFVGLVITMIKCGTWWRMNALLFYLSLLSRSFFNALTQPLNSTTINRILNY